MKIGVLFKAAMRGHSIARITQNDVIGQMVVVGGKCIDLGAKSSKSSYFQHMQVADGADFTFVDMTSSDEKVVMLDLDNPFPIDDQQYDNALAFNVLEHVYETRNVLSESYRILKPGGVLYGGNPFMYKYHKDPTDYWRFTHEAMERLLREAGFSDIEVRGNGVGCFTVATSQVAKRLRFKSLIFLAYCLGMGLDRLMGRFIKRNNEFYLGIVFRASKTSEP